MKTRAISSVCGPSRRSVSDAVATTAFRLTLGGAALLALHARPDRAAAVAGSALLLAGEIAVRWSVFRAGFQSARDPAYVVAPQRERRTDRD